MQSKNRVLDDFSNLVTNAAGALKGVGDEVKSVARSQGEKLVADMDLVTRDEYEVLKARIAKLEADIAALTSKK